MRIDNNHQNTSFEAAYINMRSLKLYGKGNSQIIQALKIPDTPLRQFIRETLNSKKTESIIGDVFINFKKTKLPYEGDDLFSMVEFSFPKIKEKTLEKYMQRFARYEDKDSIAKEIAGKTDYRCGFRDYDYSSSAYTIIGNGFHDGTELLGRFLKGNEIVKQLSEHINSFVKK